jgi:hypothetical protein
MKNSGHVRNLAPGKEESANATARSTFEFLAFRASRNAGEYFLVKIQSLC